MREASPIPVGAIDEPAPTTHEFSIRDVWVAVRRRWWLTLAVFGIVVAIGLWRTMNQPRIYRAAATVRVEPFSSPIAGIQASGPQYDYRVDPLVSEQEVIRSRMVAERVVASLGLRLQIVEPPGLLRETLFGGAAPHVDSAALPGAYLLVFEEQQYRLRSGGVEYARAPYGRPVSGGGITVQVPSRPPIDEREVVLQVSALADVAAHVRGTIQTRVVPQTNIMEISYVGTDPGLVRDAVNTIADTYRATSSELARTNARAKSRFIASSLRDQEALVVAAQDRLKRFKEREEISDVGTEQGALSGSIHRMETDRQDAHFEQKVYEALVGKLAEADTVDEELRKLVGTKAIVTNQYVATLFNRWFDHFKQRENLLAQGKNARNPDVQAVDRLITRTKQDLQSASKLYLQALDSRIGSLDKTVTEMRRQTKKYPALEAEQGRLESNVRTLQNTYDNLQAEYQMARIAESVDGGGVQVLDEANRPAFAIAPNRRRSLFYSVSLGLLLGVVVALLFERLDSSVKSPEELREQLALPLLGLIPAIRPDRTAERLEPATLSTRRLVTHADPRSPVAEAYRSLRTNLAFARTHQSPHAIVIASPGPADGKSTTAANLAITFAQQGQRTLLVDADLRRAVLNRIFALERSPGLSEFIVGDVSFDDIVHATQVPNLSLVCSGRLPPNPSELLGSARMREMLTEAKARFDVLILDSPPLLAVTDGAVLSAMADGTVLVIRTAATKREAARRALGHVRAVHGRVIGAVLNDVDMRGAAYYSGYGSYYYYHNAYYGQSGNGRNGHGRSAVRRLRQMIGRSSDAEDELS